MGLPIFLTNKNLTKDEVFSASEQYDQFIDQPVKSPNNTGSLSLVSSGSYRGSAELDMKIEIETGGDVGVGKYYFSDDGGTVFYGLNDIPIFEDFEIITESTG